MVPFVQSRAFPIHYMDPALERIKGADKGLEIRGYSLVFPIAVPRWIRAFSAANLFRVFRVRFLTPALFRLGLCPLAGLFDALLNFGFRQLLGSIGRGHLENRPLDAAPGQLTSP